MLKLNSINVHCKFGARQKWELAGRIGDFGNFLNGFAKSPRLIVVNFDWVQFVSKKCEILHSVRGLYSKTVPHSTVSPQMWCINGIKGWFTRTQICWQDFVKQTCRKQKIRTDLFSRNMFSRPNLLWSRAISYDCFLFKKIFDASGFPVITPSLRFRSLKFLNLNGGQMLRLLVIRQIQVFRLLGCMQ